MYVIARCLHLTEFLLQVLKLDSVPDNINVDPITGNLIVGTLVQPLKLVTAKFGVNAVPSRCLHVSLDQNAVLPFDNHSMEELFSSTGEDGVVGSVTGCVHVNGKLVVGTIERDMMVCDAPYLMYK